jgi:hypothetical protein
MFKRQLVRYDVVTGKRQVLVADTGTLTALPAVSPDGKRVAVARLFNRAKKDPDSLVSPAPDKLVVIVYDLEGKELHRSPELVWRKEGNYEAGCTEGATALSWGPKGNEDKLAIFELSWEALHPELTSGVWGLADLKTKRLAVRTDTPFPLPYPTICLRPDAGGFLVRDGVSNPESIAFVDWEGNKHPIAMKKAKKEGLEKGPFAGTPKWEGNTFVGNVPIDDEQYDVRIDTEKLVGVFEQNRGAGRQSVGGWYAFPDGGATAQVIAFEEVNKGVKQTCFRLEVGKPGEKSQVIVDKMENLSVFFPAPKKKLVATRVVKEMDTSKAFVSEKILLFNSEGKLVKEIVEPDK